MPLDSGVTKEVVQPAHRTVTNVVIQSPVKFVTRATFRMVVLDAQSVLLDAPLALMEIVVLLASLAAH